MPGYRCNCYICEQVKVMMGSKVELDHPCRETCYGWKQGYEKGTIEQRHYIFALLENNSGESENKDVLSRAATWLRRVLE